MEYLSPPPDLAVARREGSQRHRRLVATAAVLLVASAVLFAAGWAVGRTVQRPAQTPYEAIARLEVALQLRDEAAVARILTPGNPDRRAAQARDLVDRYGDPGFRFVTVTVRPTISTAYYGVETVAEVRGQQVPLSLGAGATMAMEVWEESGWLLAVIAS